MLFCIFGLSKVCLEWGCLWCELVGFVGGGCGGSGGDGVVRVGIWLRDGRSVDWGGWVGLCRLFFV